MVHCVLLISREECLYLIDFKNKVKLVKDALSCSVMSDALQPHGLYLPGSSAHGILQVRVTEWLPFPPSGDDLNTGMGPRSPALQHCRRVI